jgi:putative methionine-R-sulfoxide reductase with GAF domain
MRAYGDVVTGLSVREGVLGADRDARMRGVVDALWERLSVRGVSWLGFYLIAHDAGRGDEMVLGARRDKPACSPIGMHGACGRSYLSRRPLVVSDVARLGAGYIACDPRDRSEVVLPLFNADESCWGVFDVDSFDVGAFDESDVTGLQAVMEAAGLTTRRAWNDRIDTV